jgi:hypothetical protein
VPVHGTGYQFRRFAESYFDEGPFDFMKNMSTAVEVHIRRIQKLGVKLACG